MALNRRHLEYRGYYARIDFDPSADSFHGRIVGIRDVIDFYGRTPAELRAEIATSVDDYLLWCAEDGVQPEKTWQGKLTLRIDDDLRHRLAAVAASCGESVNGWVSAVLDRETRRVLADSGKVA